jgi:hypothetical protein
MSQVKTVAEPEPIVLRPVRKKRRFSVKAEATVVKQEKK